LYLQGAAGAWVYLVVAAAAAIAAAAALVPGKPRGLLEAPEYLCRRSAVCVVSAPLLALSLATLAAVAALSLVTYAMTHHAGDVMYGEFRAVRVVGRPGGSRAVYVLLAGSSGERVPWTWEAAAFLAAALGCTIAAAVLTAT
jgi:hypothetical protein